MKRVLLVLVGGEPVLGDAFCVCWSYLFCTACRMASGRGTTSLRIHLATASGHLFLPLLVFPSYSYYFSGYWFPFFSFFFFLSFFFAIRLLSLNVSGLLACVCCACRIQYDGMALHSLLPLLHYDVVSVFDW